MPATFPQVWLNRVRTLFTTQDQAPWLDGVEELNVQVIEVGSGTASESNIIHIPTTDFEPDVLINNTTYPIALQAYTDDEVTIQLDKYQTKVTTVSDDDTMGASYPKIDGVTKTHVTSITKKKYQKAIHSLAPGTNSADTPIVECTGTTVGSRKQMTYADLVAMKAAADKMEMPAEGRRVVLSSDHFNDLLLSTGEVGKALVNYSAGKTVPIIAGWEIYTYVANPYYTSVGVKNAFGSIPGATDRRASIFFSVPNVVKKTGLTKQYFSPSTGAPTTQSNQLSYRHYFIALPVRAKYLGANY